MRTAPSQPRISSLSAAAPVPGIGWLAENLRAAYYSPRVKGMGSAQVVPSLAGHHQGS